MNRLNDATSPYLLQHAGNPVDWWPWSGEAFAEARRRDVPVLLSIGYSACHWCHVMAHESFEDEATAALMNDNLVAIKVDREERPDVDAVYMAATTALTGQGGWPMTVFMTADGEPFYCGTYFPREHFQRLIRGVVQAWREDRDAVTGQARKITEALTERAAADARPLAGQDGGETNPALAALAAAGDWDPAGPVAQALDGVCAAAVDTLAGQFDRRNAGFGGWPKFPPSMTLEFLLRQHARTGEPRALRLAERTLDAMARGGIYDQLGGGFARYSVDAAWIVPHFEKMLYDNALLARDYLHLWRLTGGSLARRVAVETCDWMVRELRTAEGGLASALDADSEGVEGKFYVWTPDELADVLGAGDGEYAAATFGVTEKGTFEHGLSVLQLREDPGDGERFARVRAALFDARGKRVRPGRDDKVVAAWNGMAIAALAETGLLLDRPDLVDAAVDVARLLVRVHATPGAGGAEGGTKEGGRVQGAGVTGAGGLRLARTSRDGVAGPSAGLLEDYACVAEGFTVLAGVTGDADWVRRAGELLETALTRFADGEGGFYDTADDGEALLYRPSDPTDNATPSGTFAVAGALLSYAALTGSARHREAAIAALSLVPAVGGRFPRAAGAGLAAAAALLSGPAEIAVVGPPGDPRTAALHTAALAATSPGAVVALGDGRDDGGIPLLAGRGPIDGVPAGYVCRQFICRTPATDAAELARLIREG